MRRKIEEWIKNVRQKVFNTAELLNYIEMSFGNGKFIEKGGYERFANDISELVKENRVSPIYSSKSNRRQPELYNKYRKVEIVVDRTSLSDELMMFDKNINIDYYLRHPETYKKEKEKILLLDSFLNIDDGETLNTSLTINERSYQIFRNEKFLSTSEGKEFIRHVGLKYEDLNCYNTYEPFFYISYGVSENCNALIIENKDTFYTIKQIFAKGMRKLDELEYSMLIYGEGKKILRSMDFFCEIPEYSESKVRFYYFGDLDYEGISIFQNLRADYLNFDIIPHTFLYQSLIQVGEEYARQTPKDQKTVNYSEFLEFFPKDYCMRISDLLDKGLYIPQEALSTIFFRQYLR